MHPAVQRIYLLFADFVDLLYPTLCVGCAKSLGFNEGVLCTKCRINLPETYQHRKPYNDNLLNKFAGKVPVRFVTSFVYFKKGGIVQKLIHKIKYKGQKEVAKEIGCWYGYQLASESELLTEVDLFIGVPLHKSRLRQRGYNQADWIAKGLSEALNIPVAEDVLICRKFKDSQTRKNRLQRWENVKTVFSVQDASKVSGKNIALVDDVLTTGATLEACAVELLKSGCKSVGFITLAAVNR
ncbi:ComF family protein [Spirosoma sp.]|uniref:ComF family protein n=1 Tax=Spirosoma sp. TaxID=1899569 RepID=UPI00260B6332|nr:ComF family protein [Spirosoma sp.]MCX6213214.1 ComF family protein [Spirosoma sp.]